MTSIALAEELALIEAWQDVHAADFARGLAEVAATLNEEQTMMKLQGWIFHTEGAHRDGVELTFAPATGRAAKGKFNLICKRDEVKNIVGELRPGDFVEITIAPGTSQAPPAPPSK